MRYKKISQAVLSMLLLMAIVSCGNSEQEAAKEEIIPTGYTIKGNIDSLAYKMAYLAYRKDGKFVKVDSSNIENNTFSFKGEVASPKMHYILFDDSKDRILLFVENSAIAVSGINLVKENIVITGSETNDQLMDFNEKSSEYDDRLKVILDEYYAAKESGDEQLLEEVLQKYQREDSMKIVFAESYIKKNLNSVVAPYLSVRYMMNKDPEVLEALSKSFSDDIRNSEYVQIIEERVAVLKNTAIGQSAPLFEMNDKDGNPVALERFKGKYVLIDFWASWCGPCREENPNVVAAFEKYNDKGFEIFGVSFDDNKEKWLQAVVQDGLTWVHVSDLKGWGNAVGKIYGVKSIPHSVLIDKDGVIIAKNLRGKELHQKLEEIFGMNN